MPDKEKLKIAEIKAKLNSVPVEDIPTAVEEFLNDERTGVKSAVSAALKKYNKYLDELNRLEKMSYFENLAYEEGVDLVAGIDEVGRGPLAGPVVTACVILPKGCKIQGVNDSKKLSAAKREQLYDEIKEKAVSIGIGIMSHEVIDEVNILQATYKAMRQAIDKMSVKPQRLLVDAVHIPDVDIYQVGIIKGDAKSISIAAASIIAKVTRDRMMAEFAKKYPHYDFENNMGYGTAKHIEGLKKYGACDIHRLTFIKNLI
jgi:ribonuclease HII